MAKESKKQKKKERKEKKFKKSKAKKRKRSCSSSSSSGNEGEWVEKESVVRSTDVHQPREREGWMSMENIFSGKTLKEIKESKQKPEEEKRSCVLDQPGQSSRELNPYWKNGGTGLPPEKSDKDLWDQDYDKCHRKRGSSSSEDSSPDSESSDDNVRRKPLDSRKSSDRRSEKDLDRKLGEISSRSNQGVVSSNHGNDSSYNIIGPRGDLSYKKKLNFKKPIEDASSDDAYKSRGQGSTSKKWKKPGYTEDKVSDISSQEREEAKGTTSSSDSAKGPNSSEILSLNQMNELSAAILKAEIMGNKKLASELKAKLKEARESKEASKPSELYDEKGRKVILLTETDSKGFTRPSKTFSDGKYSRKKKADTHEGKERVRYFADDDKYSLNEMFEKEKYETVEDHNATFLKLANKQGKDMDDDEGVFDSARMDYKEKDDNRRRNRAIKKQAAKEKALDNCRFCFGTKSTSSECIVFTKEKVYLAVPSFKSLTEFHCLIVPQFHISAATLTDEDIWEEIIDLRKELVRAFEKNEEDVIFFESAMYIEKQSHMILHCVPVPKEIGETAPIYFKKAIMECESEWSNNKKVVELAGKNVKKCVPKGLPYFAVDFGMQSGYAHVIEDKRLFPHNFAQEIIGGMLDLDHSLWRKPRRDSEENIKKKVNALQHLLGLK